jgi:hypothetical protein
MTNYFAPLIFSATAPPALAPAATRTKEGFVVLVDEKCLVLDS